MNIIDWHIMNNGLNGKIDKGFILYGASGTGKRMALLLNDLGLSDKVLAVVDSDKKKWGNTWLQYKISAPDIINFISSDAIIVITSIYLYEIYQYLHERMKCSNEVCSGFSLRHAFHYDIMNNRSFYLKTEISENYKNKYILWKNNRLLRNFIVQQRHFLDMEKCIMENLESILLCAMLKTGNMSLSISFEEDKRLDMAFTLHASYYDKDTLDNLKKTLQHFSKNEIKIISGIRKPVERIISQKWELINYPYLNNDMCITNLLGKNLENYINDLDSLEKLSGIKFNCRDYFYADCAPWFTDHIEKPFGIDVFEYPFDKEKGYLVIKKNNISIFLYRLDKLSELEKEIGKFINDNSFKLKKTNAASKKRYAFAYKEYLENVKIDKAFFYNLVESRGMTHFYTDEECKKYKNKWKDRLV